MLVRFLAANVLLEIMSERNITDCQSWNILIRWLCEIKSFVILDHVTYSALVVGKCRLGKYEEAIELFHQICTRCWALEYMECKFNKRRRVSNSEVKIGDYIIPQVTRFKYLGSVIQDDGEIEGDVNHRIQAGWMK